MQNQPAESNRRTGQRVCRGRPGVTTPRVCKDSIFSGIGMGITLHACQRRPDLHVQISLVCLYAEERCKEAREKAERSLEGAIPKIRGEMPVAWSKCEEKAWGGD